MNSSQTNWTHQSEFRHCDKGEFSYEVVPAMQLSIRRRHATRFPFVSSRSSLVSFTRDRNIRCVGHCREASGIRTFIFHTCKVHCAPGSAISCPEKNNL